jgi:hypothetical protein
MFLSAVGVPTHFSISFAWDFAVTSLGNGTPKFSTAIILVSLSVGARIFVEFPDSDVFEIFGYMLFPTVGIPTLSVFGLAWNPTMFSVCDSAPLVPGSVALKARGYFLLVRIGTAGGRICIPIPRDVFELLSCVLLASVGKPTGSLLVGLTWNFPPLSFGDGAVVVPILVLAMVFTSGATRFGVHWVILKVRRLVFSTTIWEPTYTIFRLSRNAAPFGVCNCTPKTTCSIALISWSWRIHSTGSGEDAKQTLESNAKPA